MYITLVRGLIIGGLDGFNLHLFGRDVYFFGRHEQNVNDFFSFPETDIFAPENGCFGRISFPFWGQQAHFSGAFAVSFIGRV